LNADSVEQYREKLEDVNFFVLETQMQLCINPYFFELIKNPYDKESYVLQKDEIISELIKLHEENAQ
jgi:hypothetical protein